MMEILLIGLLAIVLEDPEDLSDMHYLSVLQMNFCSTPIECQRIELHNLDVVM